MIHAHERLAAAVHEPRDGPRRLIADDALIHGELTGHVSTSVKPWLAVQRMG